jgi:hypothetical protein
MPSAQIWSWDLHLLCGIASRERNGSPPEWFLESAFIRGVYPTDNFELRLEHSQRVGVFTRPKPNPEGLSTSAELRKEDGIAAAQ